MDEKSLSTRHAVHRLPPGSRPNLLDYGLQVRTIMAPQRISPHSLDHGRQLHHHTRSITASNCISEMARLWPPGASTNSLDNGLQTRSIAASKVAPSWTPRAYLQTRSISASKCISKLAPSRPPSVSPNLCDCGLQVNLQNRSMTASKSFPKLTRSWPRSVSLSSLDCHFQVHLELLWSTVCSHSTDIPCVYG